MSIAEELHKTIDELTADRQQELLETARELLRNQTEPEPENPKTDSELNQELIRRYQHLRQHPDQLVSARSSNQTVRDKHGWL
ncbi:hypothetical protein [Spirosoma montaniterrae]|uniref:Addiction module protein n=1 Tax=Spirosoma montaniterrae TaxID=1178516 RepID=A0A1P9WZK3_9BACT|nr:hypothetical protein [Spirosoma montaniterrae]AQG80809.1 hypothetical protein AWR27_16680 [Spirosoma montaniterrae]